MIDRFNKWLHAWKSRGRDIWIRGHVRSAPGEKPRKTKDEIKPLILKATKEFLLPTDVGRAMVMIADECVAQVLQEFRSEKEAEVAAGLLKVEATNHRLDMVDTAVEEIRAITSNGVDCIEELNRSLGIHEANAAGTVEGINGHLARLQEEVAKETADRHGAISHLHAALTEKISATYVEQMFQKLQAEARLKDCNALLKEQVTNHRLQEVEAAVADIRVVAGSVIELKNWLTELRTEIDGGLNSRDQMINELRTELQTLKERLNRQREVLVPTFTMRLEGGDDGVVTLVPVVQQASQARRVIDGRR